MAKRRKILVKVLPGEPLDGSGRVCIHLWVHDPAGIAREPHVLHPVLTADGKPDGRKLLARPTSGRLACDPKRRTVPVVKNGVTIITHRTDDPRAATCPKCLASQEYADLMKLLGEKG